MGDPELYQPDNELWRTFHSFFNEQRGVEQSGLNSLPQCPQCPHCSQPLPHASLTSFNNDAAVSYPDYSFAALNATSTDASFRNMYGQLEANVGSFGSNFDVGGPDPCHPAQRQITAAVTDPDSSVVYSSADIDELESITIAQREGGSHFGGMLTPSTPYEVPYTTFDERNMAQNSAPASPASLDWSSGCQLPRCQTELSHYDFALTNASKQRLPEGSSSPPHHDDWVMSSPFSEAIESQGNSFNYHAIARGPMAGDATTFPEIGPSSEGESRPARSEIASEGGVAVVRSASRKRKRKDLAGNNQHRCEQCKAAFKEWTKLRRHQRVHLRPHKCPTCSRGFTYKKDLDRHERTKHSLRRPFKCPVTQCRYAEKGFKRRDNLARHLKTLHPNTGYVTVLEQR